MNTTNIGGFTRVKDNAGRITRAKNSRIGGITRVKRPSIEDFPVMTENFAMKLLEKIDNGKSFNAKTARYAWAALYTLGLNLHCEPPRFAPDGLYQFYKEGFLYSIWRMNAPEYKETFGREVVSVFDSFFDEIEREGDLEVEFQINEFAEDFDDDIEADSEYEPEKESVVITFKWSDDYVSVKVKGDILFRNNNAYFDEVDDTHNCVPITAITAITRWCSQS